MQNTKGLWFARPWRERKRKRKREWRSEVRGHVLRMEYAPKMFIKFASQIWHAFLPKK